MKRIISLLIILATILLLTCSCSMLPEQVKFCKVKFYVDGELYETKTVAFGQAVNMPETPHKTNEVFIGWGRTDGAVAYYYDFSNKVTTDVDLYAYFVIDAPAMANMVMKQTIKSIVTVQNRCYNTLGGSLGDHTSQGSGVIVNISGGYCYVLTNYHVVVKEEGYAKQSFTVEDAWGNKYEAQIYKNYTKSDYAMSKDYDLALLCFRYTKTGTNDLEEITFGADPQKADYIASLGTPSGLQNAVTYGHVYNYQKVNTSEDESLQKVTFDVIVHNAPLNHGSSGGALINTKGELVGINFAGYDNGEYGCAIPISKVVEFMNTFVY